ncbi:MAG: hypothetical protein ACK5NT_06675 [Pyrinomonadaceae bacterium]
MMPSSFKEFESVEAVKIEFPNARQAMNCDFTFDDKNPSESSQAQTFHGYKCKGNCAGHKAGYEWAEEKGISDPEDCGGKSRSFIEGCKAYAEIY